MPESQVHHRRLSSNCTPSARVHFLAYPSLPEHEGKMVAFFPHSQDNRTEAARSKTWSVLWFRPSQFRAEESAVQAGPLRKLPGPLLKCTGAGLDLLYKSCNLGDGTAALHWLSTASEDLNRTFNGLNVFYRTCLLRNVPSEVLKHVLLVTSFGIPPAKCSRAWAWQNDHLATS